MNTVLRIVDIVKRHPRHAVACAAGFLVFGVLMFSVVLPILAAPPTSPYTPGETLNPTCAPGAVNCTVSPPVIGSGTIAGVAIFSGSGTVTSLASFTFTTSTNVLEVGGTVSSTQARIASSTVGTLTVTSCTGCGAVNGVIATGTVGYFPTYAATTTLSATSSLYWDSANLRIGIGTTQPSSTLHVVGTSTFSGSGRASYLTIPNITGITGANNIVLGDGAGKSLTTASQNVIIGDHAGDGLIGSGSNTLIGNDAGTGSALGVSNVAIGSSALSATNNTTAVQNVAIGGSALGALTTGNDNIAIGVSAGSGGLTVGSSNIFIGSGTSVAAFDTAASIALGRSAAITANNQFVIGSNAYPISTMFIGGGVTGSSPPGITIGATGGSGVNIAGAGLAFSAGRGTGTGVGGSLLFITAQASTTSGGVANPTSTSMIITQDGLVGIGTAQPSSTLHVVGSSTVNGMANFQMSGQTSAVKIGQVSNSTAYGMVSLNGLAGSTTLTGIRTDTLDRLWVQSGVGNMFVNVATGADIYFQAGALNNLVSITNTGLTTILNNTAAASKTLTVNNGVATGNILEIQDNATPVFTVVDGGNVGIGTAQPSSTLHVVGSSQFSATSTFEGYTAIGNLAAGEMSFDSDSGQVTWMDMLVTASSTASTTMSYSANIDGTKIMTIYAESDGLGGIQKPRVGIGTAFPSSTFHVAANCASITTSSQCTDYAEYYPASEPVAPAEIVMTELAPSSTAALVKLAVHGNEDNIIGIVSSFPAVIVEGNSVQLMNGANYISNPLRPAVALAGRVPVKVSDENGAVAIGDALTLSALYPGVAMKQTDPGMSVGIALEDFGTASSSVATTSTILVFVRTGFSLGSFVNDGGVVSGETALDRFTGVIQNVLGKLGLAVKDGILKVKELVADKVTTKKLCIDDVCVDKQQLQTILQQSGQSVQPPSALPLPPAPVPDPAPTSTPTPTPPVVDPAPSSTAPVVPPPADPVPTPDPVPAP